MNLHNFKVVMPFLCFQLFLICSIWSQKNNNLIKVGLIEPFFLTFNAAYEKFVPNSSFSFQISGSVTQRTVTIWENISPSIFGYSGDIQGRYYASNKLRGIYGGAFAEYSRYNIELKIPEGDVSFLSGNSKLLGVVGGYQLVFQSRLYLDFTLGGGYHFADYSGKFSDKGKLLPAIISNGLLPKIDIKFGIGF